MSNSQGICPKCSAPNEYSKTVCDMCGARLPWANAIKASDKPEATPSPFPVAAANKKTPPSPENIKSCQKTMGCGCLSFVGLFLFALYATRGVDDKSVPVAPDPYASSVASAPSQPVAVPIYNIPSLIGLDLDGVQRVLGASPPKGLTEEIKRNMIYSKHYDWLCEWDKDGFALGVNYDTRTNRVIDFFLTEDTGMGLSSGTARLISAGNLTDTSSRYRLEFVTAKGHSDMYTGVVIKPN